MSREYVMARTAPDAGADITAVVYEGGEVRRLEHHYRHSPDGFAMGYSGSGPSELARCILIDHFDGQAPARALYFAFRDRFIAPAQGPELRITSDEIGTFIREFQAAEPGAELTEQPLF